MSPIFLTLVANELRLFGRDRKALILSFVVPVVLASFFGSFVGGRRSTEGGRIEIRLVDLDGSEISGRVVAGLGKESRLRVLAAGEEEAVGLVRRGKVPVAVVLPRGFGEGAMRGFWGLGVKPRVRLAHDPSRGVEAAMVQGLLVQHVMEVVGAEMMGGAGGRRFLKDSLAVLNVGAGMEDGDGKALRGMLSSVSAWMERPAATNGVLGGRGGRFGVAV